MISSKIKEKALQLNFASCGIIPAAAFAEYKQSLDKRVSTFVKSESSYMPLYSFVTPPVAAKSIIVCLQRINKYKVPDSLGA